MLNKITAAAMSTVLCLTTAIPCTAHCSEQQTAETYASITTSAAATDNNITATDDAATSTTSATTTKKTTTTTKAVTTTVTTTAATTTTTTDTTIAEDAEPIEEGSLGTTISYKLYEDGTLFISGRGIMQNYNKSPFKSPELIKKAIVTNENGTIFSIGASVFTGCTEMTGIELPDTIITIESSAFSGCTSLADIHFDGSDDIQTGELVLSDSIEDVKASAFANCTSLVSVTVPATTMAVGNSAFAGCTSLQSAVIKGDDTSIGTSAFSGCKSLSKAVIEGKNAAIGEYIFSKCISLTDLTLPFAAFDADTANSEGSRAWLGYLFGDEVTIEGVEYTYAVRSYNGYYRYIPRSLETITITGGKNIPNNAFDGFSSLTTLSVPDDINEIGAFSFRNCSALSEFAMPSKATSIGSEAFSGCSNINVDIPEGVTKIGDSAFLNCKLITEINVPEVTESIGTRAFAGCTGLTKAVISSENVTIGEYVFSKCISLTDLTIPFAAFDADTANSEGSRAWLGYLFGDEVTIEGVDYTYPVRSYNGYYRHIPRSLETITITGGQNIPNNAFDGFSSLTTLSVPDDINEIGAAAFRGCSALTEFTMPSKATSIGSEAFSGCSNINVDIPEGVTKIGDSAFLNCKLITEINVPEVTESIGTRAFDGCTGLTKAVISSENVTIGDYVFSKCISLTDLTLPFAAFDAEKANNTDKNVWLGYMFGDEVTIEGVEFTYPVRSYNSYYRHIPCSLETITITGGHNIPNYAFDGFSSLKKISVPDNIEEIGAAAFRGCTALTEFTMPSKATSIGNEAFLNCKGISVDIPKGVTKIGSSAFANCTSITKINVPEATESIGNSAFAGCTGLTKAVIKGGSTSIGEYVFSKCISLTDLTLPFAAFSEERANSSGNNAWLGYMFGDEVTIEGVEYTYPVRSYNGYYRHIPHSLKNITFLGGTNIPNHFLEGLNGVENVTLPEELEEIGSNAFAGCGGIENVYYPGTEEEWGDVDVKANNESIEGKVVFLGDLVVLGDVNDDKRIDSVDASLILEYYAKSSTNAGGDFTEMQIMAADVNHDGFIDSVDASLILSYYAYTSTTTDDDPISLEEFIASQSE